MLSRSALVVGGYRALGQQVAELVQVDDPLRLINNLLPEREHLRVQVVGAAHGHL